MEGCGLERGLGFGRWVASWRSGDTFVDAGRTWELVTRVMIYIFVVSRQAVQDRPMVARTT